MEPKSQLTKVAIALFVLMLQVNLIWAIERPGMPRPASLPTKGMPGMFLNKSSSSQLRLDAAMDKPVLQADKKQIAYLRVGLTGFALEKAEQRAPVNISIVIDKSGSMSGQKIEKAREAAIMAIGRLSSNDILSIVTYDTTVSVLIPATKVSDKESIFQMIRGIRAGGSTALFAGVSKGAAEMRKFLADERVNRLILLSDGLANVGPKSPAELGELGVSLVKDGISVTTIGLGLGYNEDLMTKLAYKSDGSHYFAEKADDLAEVFDNEFGRALSVVAQEINVEIKCFPEIRPVRILGREGQINGQNVMIFINQLYSEHEKFFILEVEVPPTAEGQTRKLAKVNVSYGNLKTHTTDKLSSELEVTFSQSKELVEKRTNGNVMVDVVELIATERNELAMHLRDKGKIKEARKALLDNTVYLRSNAVRYKNLKKSERLEKYEALNYKDSENLDEQSWKRQRKIMQQGQFLRRAQQSESEPDKK